jgi:DNA polymerase I
VKERDSKMKIIPSPEAYDLLHQGALALSTVSNNGMPVDVGYIERMIPQLEKSIAKHEEWLKDDESWELWKSEYGRKSNLGSAEQLTHILYDVLGFEAPEDKTMSGKEKADADSLLDVGEPFTDTYVQWKYRIKCRDILANLLIYATCGRVYPNFNLNIARSYRSSCTDPNLQNIPVRNPFHAKMIRSAFVPHPDYHIVEIDFSGVEVSVAACYHKDPVMIEYLLDPEKDMHRDMAAEIFKCNPDQVDKKVRYIGKNGFVFPEFYGSYYIDRAKAIWKMAEMPDAYIEGVSPREWLGQCGVKERGYCNAKKEILEGSFEEHIKEVERFFWEERFGVYGQWKKDAYTQYLERGHMDSFTGFVYEGNFRRNQVINFPVQGSAFHCLLWSVIQLERKLRKGWKSRLIGQIHDSVIAEVHKDELDDYLHVAFDIMCNKAAKHFEDWLIVPLNVEAEVAPAGRSWHEKKEYEIAL